MSDRFKVGIVGSGLIAKARHIPAYKAMKRDIEVCAVCDLNEKLARQIASECHIPSAYSNVSEMLAKEKLDIVDICVPPQVHAPVAIEAIEKGCHVIMEKPMALKTSDCDRMIYAAQKHGTELCVVHNDLFHPPFLKAKEIVAKGDIGDFVGMRIFLSTPRWDMIDLENHWYHKLPGGVIGETGPHMAYMTLEFLKSINDADIYAQNFLKHPWAQFDEFRIELEGEKGLSSVALSYTRNCWMATVDIFGTEASLHLDLERMLVIRHRIKELNYMPIACSSLSTIWQAASGLMSTAFKVITGRQKLGTEVVIERFIESLRRGSRPPVTGEEGRETVRAMEMVVGRLHEKYGE